MKRQRRPQLRWWPHHRRRKEAPKSNVRKSHSYPQRTELFPCRFRYVAGGCLARLLEHDSLGNLLHDAVEPSACASSSNTRKCTITWLIFPFLISILLSLFLAAVEEGEDEAPLPESETVIEGGFKKIISYSRLASGKIEKVRERKWSEMRAKYPKVTPPCTQRERIETPTIAQMARSLVCTLSLLRDDHAGRGNMVLWLHYGCVRR